MAKVKPLISDDPKPQNMQFAHFGVLNDGSQSKGSLFTSVALNILLMLCAIIIGAAAKKTIDTRQKLTHLDEPIPIKKADEPPPPKIKPPKLPPPPQVAKIEPPKIKLPKVKPPIPKPPEIKMVQPMPVVLPAPPKLVQAPPAPKVVDLSTQWLLQYQTTLLIRRRLHWVLRPTPSQFRTSLRRLPSISATRECLACRPPIMAPEHNRPLSILVPAQPPART